MTQDDLDMLQDALDRWRAMCQLADTLVMAVEDLDVDLDTEEVSHHAMSDYTLEIQRELQEFIERNQNE